MKEEYKQVERTKRELLIDLANKLDEMGFNGNSVNGDVEDRFLRVQVSIARYSFIVSFQDDALIDIIAIIGNEEWSSEDTFVDNAWSIMLAALIREIPKARGWTYEHEMRGMTHYIMIRGFPYQWKGDNYLKTLIAAFVEAAE